MMQAKPSQRRNASGKPPAVTPLPVWDALTLIRMVGQDDAMHRRMFTLFLRDAPGQIRTIEEAAAVGNCALAADVAHMLKTSTRMVGALQMGQLCDEIETAACAAQASICQALVAGLSNSYISAQERIGPYLIALEA